MVVCMKKKNQTSKRIWSFGIMLCLALAFGCLIFTSVLGNTPRGSVERTVAATPEVSLAPDAMESAEPVDTPEPNPILKIESPAALAQTEPASGDYVNGMYFLGDAALKILNDETLLAGPDKDQREFLIQAALAHQETEQQRHERDGRGPVEGEVVPVVTRASAERDAGPAAQSPEKPANEAEYMAERQQTQECIGGGERELGRAVIRARAEALFGQNDSLGALRGAGSEKENFAAPVRHACRQGRGERFGELRVAPESINIGIDKQGGEQLVRQRLVEQHEL